MGKNEKENCAKSALSHLQEKSPCEVSNLKDFKCALNRFRVYCTSFMFSPLPLNPARIYEKYEPEEGANKKNAQAAGEISFHDLM